MTEFITHYHHCLVIGYRCGFCADNVLMYRGVLINHKCMQIWLLGGVLMLFMIGSLCDNEESRQFFVELYLRYKPIMFKTASKYVDDYGTVEDLIHDAMIKLIEKEELLTTFDGCTLRAYVVYTIRNMSISFMRKQSRNKQRLADLDDDSLEVAGLIDDAPLPEEVVLMKESKEEFVRVWETLPENVRELLAGKYIRQMDNKELAEEFGCSPDSIRMKLTRARRLAIEKIKEGGFDFEPA